MWSKLVSWNREGSSVKSLGIVWFPPQGCLLAKSLCKLGLIRVETRDIPFGILHWLLWKFQRLGLLYSLQLELQSFYTPHSEPRERASNTSCNTVYAILCIVMIS